ncbi:MAG: hypothetical protein NVS9B8_15570 [Candidatus Limnocylindrales bacterium]
MTERRGDEGFSVAPGPLGGEPGGRSRRRARRFGVAVAVAAAVTIIAVARLGPRLSDRPNLDMSFFATPAPGDLASSEPSTTPAPFGIELATPLPAVTRDGTPMTGTIAIQTDALRVLGLASGTISGSSPALAGRDAVVRSASGDGWTCVCVEDRPVSGVPSRVVRVVGISAAGEQTDWTDVAIFRSRPADDVSPPEPSLDIDTRADGRRGLLAVASRAGQSWRVSLASLDIASRRLGPTVELGMVTAPQVAASAASPVAASTAPLASGGSAAANPAFTFLDGPHLRISPDGRVAFVWGLVQRAGVDEVTTTVLRAWRVRLATDGSIVGVGDAPGLSALPSYCNIVGFATADRLAWVCPRFSVQPTSEAPGSWGIGTIDLEGRAVATASIPSTRSTSLSQPLFDRSNGQIYVWDAIRLMITRIDARTLASTSFTFDPATTAAPGGIAGGGALRPDWHDVDSAIRQLEPSQLAGAPDGSRLYLVGLDDRAASGSNMPASRGIFVVDRSTLALVGRWAPAANYHSVSTTAAGLVAAGGLAGVDAQGRSAPWEASLTIHDPSDGRILVRFGQLGNGSLPLVVDR